MGYLNRELGYLQTEGISTTIEGARVCPMWSEPESNRTSESFSGGRQDRLKVDVIRGYLIEANKQCLKLN